MIAEKDKVISLTYELRLDSKNGDVIESLNPSSPLQFLFGSGRLLPKFEENISGMKTGDNFNFDLSASDAYGEVNKDAIVNVPQSAFIVDGKLDENLMQVGKTIPMQDSSGNRLNGLITSINGESVTMDFNHPLAGNHLYFSGKIVDIRNATEDELAHGHVRGGCSCDSENCADGCC